MNLKFETIAMNILVMLGFFYCIYISSLTTENFSLVALNYILICFLLYFSLNKYKLLMNPITLLLPLCLAYLYYGFMLSDRQVELRIEVQASFYLFILFYTLGTLFPLKIASQYSMSISRNKRLFADLVFVAGLITFLIESILNGGFPLLITVISRQDIYSELLFIPVLHYLVMIIAIIPSVYYYFYKYKKISKSYLYIISFVSFFVILNTLSRQLIIFGVLSYFVVYIKLNNITSTKFFLKLLLSTGILFFLVGQLRLLAQKKDISALDYLKAFSGVPERLNVNTFDVTFNLYTSLNFNTLNDFYVNAETFYYGLYTLKPVLVLLHYDEAFSFRYRPDLDGFTRLGTVISDPYLDFGIPGVILFSFFYGAILSGAFISHVKSENLGHSLIWATLSYAMVMSVFANFFNVLFIWICIIFALSFCFTFRCGTIIKPNTL